MYARPRSLLLVCLAACDPGPKPEAAKNAEKTAEVKTEPAAPAYSCLASPSWLSPSNVPPSEIGNGVPVGSETNCDFYTFAWQWFLADMQLSTSSPGERIFETFRVRVPDLKGPQCSDPTLKGRATLGRGLAARVNKPQKNDGENILPSEMAQATGDALYDQAGNVVLYSLYYTDNECQASPTTGFLPNTTEIKASWRVMSASDPLLSTYVNVTVDVPGMPSNPVTLGLVGFHLVINTPNHPEFVWATWEHKSNAPDCVSPQATPPGGWSFTSAECATCLATSTTGPDGCSSCSFNTDVNTSGGSPIVGPTGTPDQVCRVFPDGEDSTGSSTNRASIDDLNAQLTGPDGLLTKLPATDPLSVLQNYFLVGALWTDAGTPSQPATNQKGSLQLANTTMETFFQADGQNCFTCHDFDPTQEKGLCVSHVIGDLISGTSCD